MSNTYYLDSTTNQLMRYNGGATDTPIVDNVVDLQFELLRRSESAEGAQTAAGRSELPVRRGRESETAGAADDGRLARSADARDAHRRRILWRPAATSSTRTCCACARSG